MEAIDEIQRTIDAGSHESASYLSKWASLGGYYIRGVSSSFQFVTQAIKQKSLILYKRSLISNSPLYIFAAASQNRTPLEHFSRRSERPNLLFYTIHVLFSLSGQNEECRGKCFINCIPSRPGISKGKENTQRDTAAERFSNDPGPTLNWPTSLETDTLSESNFFFNKLWERNRLGNSPL